MRTQWPVRQNLICFYTLPVSVRMRYHTLQTLFQFLDYGNTVALAS